MEYGVQPVRPCAPRYISRYLDVFVQNTQTMQDASTWMTTLTCLKSQKGYLDDLLTKTATTLNALRDKQGRNDRLLSATLGPRSKKKKILQNQWRTDKTIKTCENEKKAILDCLKVCEKNMHTLECIVYPMGTCTTAAEYNSNHSEWSYTNSATTDFNWNGWTDEGPMSPFHRQRQGQQALLMLDEIPPCHHSVLSPEATLFELQMTHSQTIERRRKEFDKLSIEAASGHVLHRLSVESWKPDLKQDDASVPSAATGAPVRRTRSA